ncbi:MAG TPA: DUF4832 domain-containing protein [Pirellulaceae bacterium]|jgi:hypothetical protein|nr:DUF4832 domain-containing protein [Pirellulaceae bacterium]
MLDRSSLNLLRVALLATMALPLGALAAENVVVRPLPKAGPLDNPLKGWCPYANAGEIRQPYSMTFQYVSWRELEPKKGDFRFDDWERAWDVDAAKDKHVIFRVYVDYPSRPSGLPEWLRSAGVKETPYEEHGGGRSPDYDHPEMVAGMERLIAALGERYDRNPRIAFIQLGLLGFWGEWHTYPQGRLYASPATERSVIDAYRAAFPNKSLMVRYPSEYAGRQDWLGFHDDMFPEDTDNGKDWSFLAKLRKADRTENWKVAVVGGEMTPGRAKQWLGPDYEVTSSMLKGAHFTWVGPYCPALDKSKEDSFRQRSEELVRRMGYEFRIRKVEHAASAKPGRPASLTLEGENLGVAPFYYPWSVELALLDGSGEAIGIHRTGWDLRKWLPGAFEEQASLEFDVPPGIYRLAIGIRDPWKNRPSVGFANDLSVASGWTTVSELRIDP